jgi:hypothetical protein
MIKSGRSLIGSRSMPCRNQRSCFALSIRNEQKPAHSIPNEPAHSIWNEQKPALSIIWKGQISALSNWKEQKSASTVQVWVYNTIL